MRNFTLPSIAAVVLAGGFCCLASWTPGAGSAAPDAAGEYKTVAPLDVVMEKADEIFAEIPKKIEKKSFRSVKKDALFLAEISNLVGQFKSEPDFKKLADTGKDLFLQLSQESGKKEPDAAQLEGLRKKIDANCEACHEKFKDK